VEEAGGGVPDAASLNRRRRLVAVIFLVDALILAGGLFLVGGRYWRGDVDLSEALARFRAAGAAATSADAVPGLPAPGVYRYATTGGERVSLFDTYRRYSPTTMRIVTRRGCGVREEQYFVTQHLEVYDRCGPALVTYGTDIAYWWTHGTQDFSCQAGTFDMAGMRPGAKVEWDCGDEDTKAHQITEYLDDETIAVEGVPLPARHTRWTTLFSGATSGGAIVEDWFDPSTGLLLKETRNIALRVGSQFVGRLDYTDRSSYTLLAITPSR
jgi:hypothetical protein